MIQKPHIWASKHQQAVEIRPYWQFGKKPSGWGFKTDNFVWNEIDVNDCVKTNYDQMESDEPRDENSMEYSDQSELSDAYYTKKLHKVNKEDRQDGDKLSRQG
ncbi:hypothetical protein Tco_0981490 [Tanacetum coccineum]